MDIFKNLYAENGLLFIRSTISIAIKKGPMWAIKNMFFSKSGGVEPPSPKFRGGGGSDPPVWRPCVCYIHVPSC